MVNSFIVGDRFELSAAERCHVLPLLETEARVPRYFFDLHDGVNSFDENGTELADLKAVYKHMLSLAIRIMMGEKSKNESWCIEALNEIGEIIATAEFDVKTGKLT